MPLYADFLSKPFWKHVARTCRLSAAVFCYDLMNEPIVPGEQTDDWLMPEGLGDMFYVQKITRMPNGRTSHEIAKAWVDCLVTAIRSEDERHLIAVGVIPWATVWPNAKPLFYDPAVAENLDFVSVHFYPEKQKIEEALPALKVYAIGKLLVIAEMFSMKCSIEEMDRFIDGSKPHARRNHHKKMAGISQIQTTESVNRYTVFGWHWTITKPYFPVNIAVSAMTSAANFR